MKSTKLYQLKKLQTEFPSVRIATAKESYDFIRQFYGDDIEIFESFFLLCLNRKNETIGYAKISQGGMSGTVVDMKIVAKFAVESMANGVIVAHNHPSGSLTPSENDKELTTKIVEGLKLLDIKVYDHIILTSNAYYSFANEGLID